MTHALVTGASSGLGALFARELAATGTPLILTARRRERLDELAADLSAKGGSEAVVMPADLAQPGAAEALMAEVAERGLTVSTLINNAGFGLAGDIGDQPLDRILEMIQLNVVAMTTLARLVLPGMRRARGGGILNVASVAAFQPGPHLAVYYATKAYVLSFSEALHVEEKPHGIRVSALCPGPTVTEFAGVAGIGSTPLFRLWGGEALPVVRAGLAGLAANRAVVIPGALNAALVAAGRFVPRAVTRNAAAQLQRRRGA